MEQSSNVLAEAEPRTYWPMARATNADLLALSMPRVNLLLTGTHDLIQLALMRLIPSLCGPIEVWIPKNHLQLPPPSQPGTLILRNVEAMSSFDQHRLLNWLESPHRHTRVISTTTASLPTLVDIGAFDSALFIRLNIAAVDLTE